MRKYRIERADGKVEEILAESDNWKENVLFLFSKKPQQRESGLMVARDEPDNIIAFVLVHIVKVSFEEIKEINNG